MIPPAAVFTFAALESGIYLNSYRLRYRIPDWEEGTCIKLNIVSFISLLIAVNVPLMAQGASSTPAKAFTGNFGAGFALTGGNSDTKSVEDAGVCGRPLPLRYCADDLDRQKNRRQY